MDNPASSYEDLMATPAHRWLCAATADGPIEGRSAAACRLLDAMGDEAAFAFATENRVAPHVAHALLATQSPEFSVKWRTEHDSVERRLIAYMAELDDLAARLTAEGVLTVALKNGGIARGIYPCLGCCPMDDIDLLIQPTDFSKAHDVLQAQQYAVALKNDVPGGAEEAIRIHGVAEYSKTLINGYTLCLEVHCRPVTGRWIRADQEPDAAQLVARSLPVSNGCVRVLRPVENLLQVCLHTARHTYVRAPGLRLHTDVDRIVRHQRIDWDQLVRDAETYRIRTAIYLALAIPVAAFNTPIPVSVLKALRPGSTRERMIQRALRRAGLFSPDEPKFPRWRYLLLGALLYDNVDGLWRAVFPKRAWMTHRYGAFTGWRLLVQYVRRWIRLISGGRDVGAR